MENPATWSKLEWIIRRALRQAEEYKAMGHLGLSTEMLIANALRQEGLVVDDERTRIKTVLE